MSAREIIMPEHEHHTHANIVMWAVHELQARDGKTQRYGWIPYEATQYARPSEYAKLVIQTRDAGGINIEHGKGELHQKRKSTPKGQ